jgi:hypothetical protein
VYEAISEVAQWNGILPLLQGGFGVYDFISAQDGVETKVNDNQMFRSVLVLQNQHLNLKSIPKKKVQNVKAIVLSSIKFQEKLDCKMLY